MKNLLEIKKFLDKFTTNGGYDIDDDGKVNVNLVAGYNQTFLLDSLFTESVDGYHSIIQQLSSV